MIAPAAVVRKLCENGRAWARCGAYGWYEAIDYTRARLPEGAKFAVVRAYMAHHQAMTIVGIANALHDGQMRARFHAEPIIQATELLLQERMPRDVALARPPPEHATADSADRKVCFRKSSAATRRRIPAFLARIFCRTAAIRR